MRPRRDSNPQSSDPKSDALSIRPRGHLAVGRDCGKWLLAMMRLTMPSMFCWKRITRESFCRNNICVTCIVKLRKRFLALHRKFNRVKTPSFELSFVTTPSSDPAPDINSTAGGGENYDIMHF